MYIAFGIGSLIGSSAFTFVMVWELVSPEVLGSIFKFFAGFFAIAFLIVGFKS